MNDSLAKISLVIGLGVFFPVAIGMPASRVPSSGTAVPTQDPRSTAIRRVFGQTGEQHDGYFRVNFPRTDLHVRIGSHVLDAGFELTSYMGFVPVGAGDVLTMGEFVLRDDEVAAVLDEARRQKIQTPAVHNHLIGETPRIVYVHVTVRGPAEVVATKLKAVFSKTATPMVVKQGRPPSVDWSAIDAILGKHAEGEGRLAEYVFSRRERLTEQGIGVKSTGMLETASEVVFQQLDGGRMACGGELFVLPSEIDAVARALGEHGLHATAIHNHMVAETPRLYWMHWYGTGDGAAMARGVAAALARMNSVQKSASEG
jgi:hypothetical protein